MNSKDRVNAALNHKSPDRVAVDFGSTAVTGMHVTCVAGLRDYYGLEERPVKVCEPYQMLGEIDNDLMEILGIDVIGLSPSDNMFSIPTCLREITNLKFLPIFPMAPAVQPRFGNSASNLHSGAPGGSCW